MQVDGRRIEDGRYAAFAADISGGWCCSRPDAGSIQQKFAGSKVMLIAPPQPPCGTPPQSSFPRRDSLLTLSGLLHTELMPPSIA